VKSTWRDPDFSSVFNWGVEAVACGGGISSPFESCVGVDGSGEVLPSVLRFLRFDICHREVLGRSSSFFSILKHLLAGIDEGRKRGDCNSERKKKGLGTSKKNPMTLLV
jgi:hypothetical protein